MYLYEHIQNFLIKVFAFIFKLIGIFDIVAKTEVKTGTRRLWIIFFISTIFLCFQNYFYILCLPKPIVISIDIILSGIEEGVSTLIVFVATLNQCLKLQKILHIFKIGIELKNSVMPFKDGVCIDRCLVYQVLTKFTVDLSVLLIKIVVAVGMGVPDFMSFLIVGAQQIIFSFQYLTFFMQIIWTMIIYTYAAHLMNIIEMNVRRSALRLEKMNETLSQASTQLMNECCRFSDEFEHFSEAYTKVVEFSRQAMVILEPVLLLICFQNCFLTLTQMAGILDKMDFEEKPVIQFLYLCLGYSTLYYITYGPQKLLQKSENLLAVVASLSARISETRLNESVSKRTMPLNKSASDQSSFYFR